MPRANKTLPGYRRLSPKELRERGISATAERYEFGGELVSKRQYLKAQRFAQSGEAISNEKYSAKRGTKGQLHTRARINLFADAYAKKYNKRRKHNLMTRADALADPSFKDAYKRLQSLHKTRRNIHGSHARHLRGREMQLLFDRLNMKEIVDNDGGRPYPRKQ